MNGFTGIAQCLCNDRLFMPASNDHGDLLLLTGLKPFKGKFWPITGEEETAYGTKDVIDIKNKIHNTADSKDGPNRSRQSI